MFMLFFNLYLAMFSGVWKPYNLSTWWTVLRLAQHVSQLGEFITSIFGDNSYTSLGDALMTVYVADGEPYLTLWGILALVLATITSIGIVVMAVKGVKKAFGIFFGRIR